jgi:hypothetical protein
LSGGFKILSLVHEASGYLEKRFARREPVLADKYYVAILFKWHNGDDRGVLYDLAERSTAAGQFDCVFTKVADPPLVNPPGGQDTLGDGV